MGQRRLLLLGVLLPFERIQQDPKRVAGRKSSETNPKLLAGRTLALSTEATEKAIHPSPRGFWHFLLCCFFRVLWGGEGEGGRGKGGGGRGGRGGRGGLGLASTPMNPLQGSDMHRDQALTRVNPESKMHFMRFERCQERRCVIPLLLNAWAEIVFLVSLLHCLGPKKRPDNRNHLGNSSPTA